jgi:hypothetical protein
VQNTPERLAQMIVVIIKSFDSDPSLSRFLLVAILKHAPYSQIFVMKDLIISLSIRLFVSMKLERLGTTSQSEVDLENSGNRDSLLRALELVATAMLLIGGLFYFRLPTCGKNLC